MNDMVQTTAMFAYKEGDAFVLPVDDKHALGVIARITKKRSGKTLRRLLVAYFFGPYYALPTIDDLKVLNPGNAILIRKTQDEGLYIGRW